jgi:type IV secretion system protein VirD4
LWTGTLLVAISRRTRIPARRTLFLVDEAAQLGPLPALRTAITLLRGSGLTVWTFWQDLSQIKHNFPDDWATLINNCGVLQTFGLAHPFLAREWAEVLDCPPRDLLTLPTGQQLVFIPGEGLSRLNKLDYLKDAVFAGDFDPNPRYAPPPARPRRRAR